MAHNDKIIGARHLGNLSEILNILSLPIDMQTGLFFFLKSKDLSKKQSQDTAASVHNKTIQGLMLP